MALDIEFKPRVSFVVTGHSGAGSLDISGAAAWPDATYNLPTDHTDNAKVCLEIRGYDPT